MTLREACETAQARTDRRARMKGRTEWTQVDFQFYNAEVERLHPLEEGDLQRIRARERMLENSH